MSKSIDFVKDHFNKYETRKIIVPEWKDDDKKPLEIFVEPITLEFELISTYTSSVTRYIRRYRCI